MANKRQNWSFSKLMVFEACPYRYKLQYLDKQPTMPNPALDRGTAIHTAAEKFVRGTQELDPALNYFKSELSALRERYENQQVSCEEEWGFTRDWDPCDWSKAWLRLKCDVVCKLDEKHALVVDFKTGRRFGNELKHARQLQLYALCTLLRYSRLEQTTNELWYLDKDELADFKLTRRQLPRYLQNFDNRGRALTECVSFTPRPNVYNCKWCDYAPHKQGGCPHGVDADTPVTRQALSEVFTRKAAKADRLFKNEDLSRFT